MTKYASFSEALRTIYPNFHWELSQFASAGVLPMRNYWKNKENLQSALDVAEKKLSIEKVLI